VLAEAPNVDGHNLVGEPCGSITFDIAANESQVVDLSVADELTRRGAWARCIQIVGAFDAACGLTVAHTGERVQFGRRLSNLRRCSIRWPPWPARSNEPAPQQL
jgi:acyl-CoA dehydrogenase